MRTRTVDLAGPQRNPVSLSLSKDPSSKAPNLLDGHLPSPAHVSVRRGAGLRAGEGTRFYLALSLITLVAIWLRLWAIDFGVPMVTHPDEPNILNPALHMIRTHDFNPHWFIYPALIIYIEAAYVVSLPTQPAALALAGT